MKHTGRHLRALGCSVLILLVLAVLLNAAIDPLSLLGTPPVPGWSTNKTMADRDGGRRFKAAQLTRAKPDILILGTSRVEVGIPPDHPAYNGRVAYDAGLSGTNMVEIERVFEYAIRTLQPREVLIGLDFLAFAEGRGLVADFADSAFALSQTAVIARHLFSANTLQKSFRTIRDNRRGVSAPYNDRGGSTYFQNLSAPDYRRMFVSALQDQFFIDPQTYAGFHFSEARMHALWRIAAKCAERGITLHLFVTPVHARQLEALRALGLYDGFERWKLALAAGAAEIKQKYPQFVLSLHDFSGYTEFTTETVPPANQPDARMQWYWESSHFKIALGNLLLNRVYGLPAAASLPDDFGLELRPGQVEGWLSKTRTARAAYAQTHEHEVRSVEQLAACTSRIWSALCKDCVRRAEFVRNSPISCAE